MAEGRVICFIRKQPSNEEISSFTEMFERELGLGIIRQLPKVHCEGNPAGFVLVFNVPEEDRAFWLGFVKGKNFGRNSDLMLSRDRSI